MVWSNYLQKKSKVSDRIRNIILMGAGQHPGQMAVEAPASAIELLLATDNDEAEAIIVRVLGEMGADDVRPTMAQCKAFRSFNAQWELLSGKPAGFSLFCNQDYTTAFENQAEELRVIEAKKEYNTNSITADENTKLTRHHIVIPSEFDSMMDAMYSQKLFFQIFFWTEAFFVKQYETFQKNLKR